MKGQAAMEFLLTYGWAILLMMLMISGLAYFGAFDIKGLIPDKCIFSAGIGCSEHIVYHDGTKDRVNIILVNNYGETIIPKKLNITDIDTSLECTCSTALCGIDGTWNPSDIKTMDFTCPNNKDNVNLKIRITYKYIKGEYDRVVEGRLQSKVT